MDGPEKWKTGKSYGFQIATNKQTNKSMQCNEMHTELWEV